MSVQTFKCPNCGAAFNPENHKCEYCGSFIFVDDKKEFNIPESMKNEISNAPGIYVSGKKLEKGEIPIRSGMASYFPSITSASNGKLYLTQSNLYFSSFGIVLMQKDVNICIPLSDIQDVKIALNLFVSQHILIYTKNGEKYRFVVYGGKEWVRMIKSTAGIV